MLDHAIYSVISPKGAASILWRDTSKAQEAATNMKITAQDLMRFGVIDQIIQEPVGGAHRQPDVAITRVGDAIEQALGAWPASRPRTSAACAARNSSPSAGPSEAWRRARGRSCLGSATFLAASSPIRDGTGNSLTLGHVFGCLQ